MRLTPNAKKIVLTVVSDVLVFAIALLTFAWFHHAKPVKIDSVVLTTLPPVPTAFVTESPVPPTGSPINTEFATLIPTEEPTPEPTGLLKGKYSDKFTDGEIIQDENGYKSKNVCIEMTNVTTMVRGYEVAYYVADIYVQDISCFRTAMAETDNNKEPVTVMANRHNAIVAVSGDYWMFKRRGLVIRNGELFRDELHPDQDVCVLYQDGTMETYLAGEVDLDYIYSKYPYQAWSFGPRLLTNGQPMTEFNTEVENWNPRCALGYYEPGHYCFVLVDGRQTSYSYGLTMQDLSQLMYDLGCSEAYNLDGGMTAMMAYNGELRSIPCGGGRQNCDILYIAEPIEQFGGE